MVHPRYFLCLFALGMALAGCQPTAKVKGKPVTSLSETTQTESTTIPVTEGSAKDNTTASRNDETRIVADDIVVPEQPIATMSSNDEQTMDVKTTVSEESDNLAVTTLESGTVIEKVAPEPIPIPIKPPAGPRQLYPNLLLGKTANQVNAAFGKPSVERIEGQVKIWQYRGDACVVDFYLYPDDNEYVVTHWSWRHPIVGHELDPFSCRAERADFL